MDENKIFVGGLSWGTDDAGLRAAFEGFGAITEAKVIQDRDTGRSRGFGFVTFADEESAAKCKEGMEGLDLDGRNLKVDYPREREDRSGGGNYRSNRTW